MMRRPLLPSGCQIGGLINRQTLTQQNAVHSRSAKLGFVTLDAGRRLAKLSQPRPSSSAQFRHFSASSSCLKAKRTPGVQSLNDPPRFGKSQASSSAAAVAAEKTLLRQQREQQPDPADIADLAAAVSRVTDTFLAQQGIPPEHMTLTALLACSQAAGQLPLELTHTPLANQTQSQNVGLNLLDLDADSNGRKGGDSSGVQATPQLRVLDLAYQISDAAYTIIAHPPVVITPQLLQEYIALQSRLGRPETFPEVLELFASKPTPKLVSGSVQYAKRNPDRVRNAINPSTAETALDTAIEAKHLDAAIGIVESTYATKAFRRSKLITKALLPVSLVGAAPVGIYLLAKQLALLQDSYDQATATTGAFVGILAYFGFTGAIGLVALATANDQMNRVTWAEGIPLTERWVREEERAAYDKISSSFGFSDDLRAGEEDGDEFHLLREFILRKGMVLDKVDLMPGMS